MPAPAFRWKFALLFGSVRGAAMIILAASVLSADEKPIAHPVKPAELLGTFDRPAELWFLPRANPTRWAILRRTRKTFQSFGKPSPSNLRRVGFGVHVLQN